MIEKEKDEEAEKRVREERQKARENAQLKIFFIIVGIVIVVVLATMFVLNQMRHFDVGGVTFNVVKEQDIKMYRTNFPYNGSEIYTYNVDVRNDPRRLEKEIPFEGEIMVDLPMNQMVINMSGIDKDFGCDRDDVLGVAELLKLYNAMGINIVKDPNATCDSKGRYMFIQIQPGEETKIIQTGPACYTLEFKECEILDVIERFMLETYKEINAEWI